MLLTKHRKDWEELAQLDPFWAILSLPDKRNGRWNPDEFFQTGIDEIDELVELLKSRNIAFETGSALDFGCGAGRLTQALARHFDRVVGVDISQGMLDLAERHNRHGDRCRYLLNTEDSLVSLGGERFDFIYTNIVLQHLPGPEIIARDLREFFRVLQPGGLLIFQLPQPSCAGNRMKIRARFWRLFRSLGASPRTLYRFGLHPILMNTLPAEAVRRLCAESEIQILSIEPYLKESLSSDLYIVKK